MLEMEREEDWEGAISGFGGVRGRTWGIEFGKMGREVAFCGLWWIILEGTRRAPNDVGLGCECGTMEKFSTATVLGRVRRKALYPKTKRKVKGGSLTKRLVYAGEIFMGLTRKDKGGTYLSS